MGQKSCLSTSDAQLLRTGKLTHVAHGAHHGVELVWTVLHEVVPLVHVVLLVEEHIRSALVQDARDELGPLCGTRTVIKIGRACGYWRPFAQLTPR